MIADNTEKRPIGHLEMTTDPGLEEMLVVRWKEQRVWGEETHIITLAKPDTMPDIQAAFARFEKLSSDLRIAAAVALRHACAGVSWEAIVTDFEPAPPLVPEVVAEQTQNDGQLGFSF